VRDGLAWAGKTIDPHRIEHRLGALLAGALILISQGVGDYSRGVPNPGDKHKFGKVCGELAMLELASRYGCHNSQPLRLERYFAGPTPSSPRLSFEDAAQYYGRVELRRWLPGVSEAMLGELIKFQLDILREVSVRCISKQVSCSGGVTGKRAA
jgi:hypothetical protein